MGRLDEEIQDPLQEMMILLDMRGQQPQGKTEYPINTSGKRTDSNGKTVRYTYGNNEWPDQLTTYNGQTITYDNSGNPLSYVNGLEFTWSRGRDSHIYI